MLAPSVARSMPLLSQIADAFLILFLIFMAIRNYQGIVLASNKLIGIIYNRDDKIRSDLVKFLIISFSLTFITGS
jgi:hypothetical protein